MEPRTELSNLEFIIDIRLLLIVVIYFWQFKSANFEAQAYSFPLVCEHTLILKIQASRGLFKMRYSTYKRRMYNMQLSN
jgi:hypothetical protein